MDAPGPRANRAALREIIAFWLDRGVAGFRVDMAYTLVKDDPGWTETTALWHELRDWMRQAYPEAVLLPESEWPAPADIGVRGGFDADFFLVNLPAHSALFNNGGAGTLPRLPDHRHCFFDADGPDGPGTLGTSSALGRAPGAGRRRPADRPRSSDHDFSRLVSGTRTAEQLGTAFTFLLTWGSIPSIYYGDEIGMRYLTGMPASGPGIRPGRAPGRQRRRVTGGLVEADGFGYGIFALGLNTTAGMIRQLDTEWQPEQPGVLTALTLSLTGCYPRSPRYCAQDHARCKIHARSMSADVRRCPADMHRRSRWSARSGSPRLKRSAIRWWCVAPFGVRLPRRHLQDSRGTGGSRRPAAEAAWNGTALPDSAETRFNDDGQIVPRFMTGEEVDFFSHGNPLWQQVGLLVPVQDQAIGLTRLQIAKPTADPSRR